MLNVSRQAFYDYLERKEKPWKYEVLAAEMIKIHNEEEYNDTYGSVRMYQALLLKKEEEGLACEAPCENTVKKIMAQIGLLHKPHRNPKGLTKADKEAQKSDDLLKRDFTAEKPLEKAVTDITEIAGNNGKLYVSAYFDCFNLEVLGLAMD